MLERDDFTERVKRALADRVGHRCSYPGCRALTSGPHTQADKRVSVGMAAHITAAAPGGARYNADLLPEERSAAENGIWMCATHGTLVDRDEQRFTVSMLRRWKEKAEADADSELGKAHTVNEAQQLEPDVSVLYTWEKFTQGSRSKEGIAPPPFEIRNFGRGHATEVEVLELAGGSFTARFALVADLSPGSSVYQEPQVIDTRGARGPFGLYLFPKSIEHLLEAADREREATYLEDVGQRPEPMSEGEMDALVEHMGERLDVSFRLTYWNREHSRQWEKSERLCYEPHAHRAYVLHGERRELK